MKIRHLVLTSFLALVVLFGSLSPVRAASFKQIDEIRIFIKNNTNEHLKIRFTGPITKTVAVEPGFDKANLVPGAYEYTYKACGITFRGKFYVQFIGDTLTLPACIINYGRGAEGRTFVLVHNRTDEAIQIQLIGPQKYQPTVQPGNLRIEVAPGKYTYTYTACDETITKKFDSAKGRGVFEIVIARCNSKDANQVGEEQGKKVTFLIHNKTSGPIYFTLVDKLGKITKIASQPGKTRLQVAAGKYTWMMNTFGCGTFETDSGIIDLNRSAIWDWWCSE